MHSPDDVPFTPADALTCPGENITVWGMRTLFVHGLGLCAFATISSAFDPAAAGTYLYRRHGTIGRVQVTRSGAFTLNKGERGEFNERGVARIEYKNRIFVSSITLTLREGAPRSMDVTYYIGDRLPTGPVTYQALRVIAAGTSAGAYTILQEPPSMSTFAGRGWATMTVRRNGMSRQAGRLWNGAPYTLGSGLLPPGIMPIAGVSSPGNFGTFTEFDGELAFASGEEGDASGAVGLSIGHGPLEWRAARFAVPRHALNLLDPASSNLPVQSTVSGSGFTEPLHNEGRFTRSGIRFSFPAALNAVNIDNFVWNRGADGALTGAFRATVFTQFDGVGHRVDGVVYQKEARAVGLISAINGSANFEVRPVAGPLSAGP